MKIYRYSFLLITLSLFLLSGCESVQRTITQVSLQELEGVWEGDYINKKNSNLDGLSVKDTHNNPLPSPSIFRKKCAVSIRTLNQPIEGFTHGIFLDFKNTRAYSKKK